MRGALPLSLLLAATLGCQSKKSDAVVAAPTTGAPMSGEPAQAQGLTGKVLERIDAAPYSYLRLQTARGEVWAAVPEAKLEKGAEVTIASPMLMNNFESKTLNRTFAEIFFGNLAPAGGAQAAMPAHAGAPQGQPAAAPGAPVVPKEAVKVDKASGADARTVAEVWAQKGGLK